MRRLLNRFVFLWVAAVLLGTCILFNFPAGEMPGTQATPPLTHASSETQNPATPTLPLIVFPTVLPSTTPLQTPLVNPEALLEQFPAGEIFFSTPGKGMMRLGLEDRTPLQMSLPTDATFPFVSPDGNRLGFVFSQAQEGGLTHYYGVSQAGSVYLPSSKSSGRSLTSQPFLAAWSPDEQLVVSVNALGSESPSTSYYIQVFAFDAQAAPDYWEIRTAFQVKGLVDLIWSPDSRGLAFSAVGEDGLRFFLAPLSQAPLALGQEQPLQRLMPQESALALQALPGNRLLYATTAGIYLQGELSEKPQLVTRSLAPYSSAALNATGRWAAIHSEELGGLFILDLLTGAQSQVSDVLAGGFGQVLEWFSDGRYLAFSLLNELAPGFDYLYVASLEGEVTFLRAIPSSGSRVGIQVSWHPSEPYLTYVDRAESGYIIWLAAADGSGSVQLNPDNPGVEAHFSWNAPPPDLELVGLPLAPEPCLAPEPRLKIGNSSFSNLDPPIVSLLYRDAGFDSPVLGSLNPGEQAWVLGGPVCIENTNFWLLRSKTTDLVGWAAEGDAQSYFLAPRSDALIFTIKNKIYALPLDVPELRLLADPDAYAPGAAMQFISPQWLPGGQSFSYLATAPNMAVGLYVQPYPEGVVLDLLSTFAQQGYGLPAGAWSPDGSRLVISLGPQNGKRDLFLIQANGSLIQNLTGSTALDDRSPSWSPDGAQIVYLSGEGADTEIYVLEPGESIFRLTNNQVEEVSPAWSPLGNRIAYAERTGGRPELFTISPNGSDRDQLSNQPGWYPAWSADGQRIAFTDPINDRLMLIDADGSDLRTLALAGDDREPVQVVWAPSGDRLAFVYQKTLYIYDLTTSSNQPVAAGLDNPWINWQP